MIPKRPLNLPWREVDGHVVILSPKTSTIHELNSVASFLWIAADGLKSNHELADALTERFAVEPATAMKDADFFFSELKTLGLISLHEA